MIAIGAAAGCVSEVFDLGVARGHQHAKKAADIGLVAGNGVGKAARNTQGSLMQHMVHAGVRLLAGGQVANVAFY